jgi:serpin B
VNTILQELRLDDVELHMPKFAYDATLDLAQTFEEMGMSDAFDISRADFSGIDGTRNLFIGSAVHKASVTVDEMGTVAAAATEVVGEVETMPIEVKIVHPFIYIIRDGESGTVLFVGRVVDPRVE